MNTSAQATDLSLSKKTVFPITASKCEPGDDLTLSRRREGRPEGVYVPETGGGLAIGVAVHAGLRLLRIC